MVCVMYLNEPEPVAGYIFFAGAIVIVSIHITMGGYVGRELVWLFGKGF